MQRFFHRNLLSTLLAILALAAAAFLPLAGVASAAPQDKTCFAGEGFDCDLVISAPESVPANKPFTVTVVIMNLSGNVASKDSCASTSVELDVYQGEGFTAYFTNASKGIATFKFSGLSAGSYALQAFVANESCGYVNDSDFVPLEVVAIPAGQPIAACPDNVVCTQTTSGGGTAATLFTDNPSDTGMFQPYSGDSFFVTLASLGGGGCGDGGPTDPNGVLAYKFEGSASSPKHIIFELSPNLVNKGIAQFNVCWQTPPSGIWFYLPNCSTTVGPPCVAHKNSLQNNGLMIEVLVPPGDPWAYVE